jgi:hypothetical protein
MIIKNLTRKLLPRPFLSTALERVAPHLTPRVNEAILKGIEFKTKP